MLCLWLLLLIFRKIIIVHDNVCYKKENPKKKIINLIENQIN